jgi:hypothetical protein
MFHTYMLLLNIGLALLAPVWLWLSVPVWLWCWIIAVIARFMGWAAAIGLGLVPVVFPMLLLVWLAS